MLLIIFWPKLPGATMHVRFWLTEISPFKKIFLTDQLTNSQKQNAVLKLKLEACEENKFILVESLQKMASDDKNKCIPGEK